MSKSHIPRPRRRPKWAARAGYRERPRNRRLRPREPRNPDRSGRGMALRGRFYRDRAEAPGAVGGRDCERVPLLGAETK